MKRNIAIVLILALVGFCAYSFFSSSEVKAPPSSLIPVAYLETKASSIEQKYSEQIRKLVHENDSLRREISIRKQALLVSRQTVIALESKTRTTMVKIKTVRDTVLKVVYCDSLQSEVDSLITQMNSRDSICEQQTESLNCLVQNKDSTISLCQKSYLELKALVDTSLEQQKLLADQLNDASKKLKHRTLGNRILSAGLLIVSGIAASTFIHHTP